MDNTIQKQNERNARQFRIIKARKDNTNQKNQNQTKKQHKDITYQKQIGWKGQNNQKCQNHVGRDDTYKKQDLLVYQLEQNNTRHKIETQNINATNRKNNTETIT